MEKAFEKQIKTTEDQGKKQVSFKPKEETRPSEDEANNKSKAEIIFNELINKRKRIRNELYGSADYNNKKFYYVDNTKDASFYEYKDSKELFNVTRNNQIKFSEVKNKQNEFLNKPSNIKIGKKTIEPKETIITLKTFIFLEKRL